MHQHSQPVFSTSRLPTDVLSLIFYAAQDMDWAKPPPSTRELSPMYIPLRLSQVSRSWRDLSTNLPLLWTTVRISSPWQFQSIRTSLSMSKSFPIELNITDSLELGVYPEPFRGNAVAKQEDAKLLCDLLAPHIHRCRSISVSTNNSIYSILMEMQERFRHLDAPLLEKMRLTSASLKLRSRPKLLFKNAPLLLDIQLNVHALVICHPYLHHVTSFHLKGAPDTSLHMSELFRALSQCLVLKDLYLYGEIADSLADLWLSFEAHCFQLFVPSISMEKQNIQEMSFCVIWLHPHWIESCSPHFLQVMTGHLCTILSVSWDQGPRDSLP